MRNATILLFLLLGLSACGTKNPPMVEHKLYIKKATPSTQTQGSCKAKDIKISLAFAKSSLMTQKMRYVKDDFFEFAYANSEWAQSPNRALTQEIFENVRDSGVFRSVLAHGSRSKSDYILESHIEEFVQHYDEELEHSYALVRITFTLVDAKRSKVIETLSLNKRVDTQTLDASGGVKALSQALGEVLHEQKLWLERVCG